MESETCETCKYFRPFPNRVELTGKEGRCQRTPPTHTGFPLVQKSDWCGEYNPVEQEYFQRDVTGCLWRFKGGRAIPVYEHNQVSNSP